MLEVLLEVIFEFVVQLFLELGFHSLIEPFQSNREDNSGLAFLGYALLGAFAGWISLLLVPSNFIRDANMQTLNVVATPVLLGFLFAWFGRLRERKGLVAFELDRFSCGFVFALAVALIRFKFAA